MVFYRLQITLTLTCISVLQQQASADLVGVYLNPKIIVGDSMALPLPLGIEGILRVAPQWSLGIGYEMLESDPLLVKRVRLHSGHYRGEVISARAQFNSAQRIMNGFIAETGFHFVKYEQIPGCAESSVSGACVAYYEDSGQSFDFTIHGGYGEKVGLNYSAFGLVGMRHQTHRTRSTPIDLRFGFGASF